MEHWTPTASRARLLSAVRDVDRLVLLGDVLELRERPWRQVLGAAVADAGRARRGAALRRLGRADGRQPRSRPADAVRCSGERSPSRRRRRSGPRPRLAAALAGEPLERVCAALGAERVTVSYPGVWLRDDVYAIHGHYLDRHTTVPTLERLAIGAVVRMAGEPAGRAGQRRGLRGRARPGVRLAGRATPGPAAGPGRARRSPPGGRLGQGNRARGGLRRRALRAAFPAIVAGLNRAGLGPVSDDVSIDTLRSSSLRRDRRGAAATAGRRAVRDLRSHAPRRAAAGRRRRPTGGPRAERGC